MSPPARTAKEALIAEMLGDLDRILARAEALPAVVLDAEARVAAAATALDAAADRFLLAVTSFSEQARTGLAEHAQRKAAEAGARAAEEARTAMLSAAQTAFRSEASDRAAQLGIALARAAKDFRRSAWSRLLEHGMTALGASMLTAGFMAWLGR